MHRLHLLTRNHFFQANRKLVPDQIGQGPSKQVRRSRLYTDFWYYLPFYELVSWPLVPSSISYDCFVRFCCFMVFLDHLKNPWRFTSPSIHQQEQVDQRLQQRLQNLHIQIMYSVLGAGFDDWPTIKVIWTNCIDEDPCFFHQVIQVFGSQRRRLNP